MAHDNGSSEEGQRLLQQFRDNVLDIDMDGVKQTCTAALEAGVKPADIIQEGIVKAVLEVGERFEAGEYFLPELILTGEMIKEAMALISPHLAMGVQQKTGTVVIGTGKGDLHDIGKNVVVTFLNAEGFSVVDLGVDVTPEQFVDAVRQHAPDILAISVLITRTMPEVEATVKALEEAGIRDRVKIILGGAPVTQKFVTLIGADAYARNAIEGVRICRGWIEQ